MTTVIQRSAEAQTPLGGAAASRFMRLRRRAADWVLAGFVLLAVCSLVQVVTVPANTLFARVAIDDALYFVLPAQHFWQGDGFCFDGLHRSSGVQPLWAGIVLLLAGLIRDSETCVRAACGVSGLLWLLSSVVLYRAFAARTAGVALLVAVGWGLTGLRDGLGVKGMENGVHALALALLVAFVARASRDGTAPTLRVAPYVKLGVCTALFCLARTENALLAGLIGLAILLGYVPLATCADVRARLRCASAFAVPPLLALGGCTALYALYFGELFPISGTVKLHYETLWGGVDKHGGVIGSLLWHVDTVGRQAFAVATELAQRATQRVTREQTTTALLGVLALVILIGAVRFARQPRASAARGLSVVLAAFTLLHLGLMALTLPHFTEYGTWYFTSEYMVAWLLLVGALAGLLRLLRIPALLSGSLGAGLALALVASEAERLVWPPSVDPEAWQILHVAGQWMNENLPAGRRIGTLSSGYVSQAAPAHMVYNLDGLMADRDYVRNYLRAGRLPDYLQREQIEYFAEYQPLTAWRDGLKWAGQVPLEAMRLVRWWRMDATLAYCVFKLSAENGGAASDRVSQVQFDAEVLGKHRVIEAAELAALPPGHRVATSIPVLFTRTLRHVVVPEADVPALGFDAHNVHPATRADATFDGALRLLGVDLPPLPARRGSRVLLSRYWQVMRSCKERGTLSLETWIHPADPSALAATPEVERLVQLGAPCHGTSDARAWREGEVVVETYALTVPMSLPPGVYPVWVGVSEDGAERAMRLSPGGQQAGGSGLVFVGNVEVCR